MLKKGLIRPSMGPYTSVFFFVTKPNGGLRGVCDFRGVNLITTKKFADVTAIRERGKSVGR